MAMASEQRVIDVADSSMEDKAESSQAFEPCKESIQDDEIRVDAMRLLEIIQLIELLPNARDHLNWILDQVTKKPYIYRVPHRLREVNKRAYEPNVISIGPYHHGNERLKRMEANKMSCFLNIVWEDNSVGDRIVRSMQSLVAEVRQCYEEPSDLNSQEYVEMMVYDGCFIVQLIRFRIVGDIFEERGFVKEIVSDLLLLENQIPFFVLSELYSIIEPKEDVKRLAHHVLSFFRDFISFHLFDDPDYGDIKHLLHLVHSCHLPPDLGIVQHKKFKGERASEPTSLRSCGRTTVLYEAGIDFLSATFQKMKDPKQGIESEFDIKFRTDTKVLMIPTLIVDDMTERVFRNYIAYEHFMIDGKPTYFSDYVFFMGNLINTSNDVQLLRKRGIINNWLGDDEALVQMFKRLQESVIVSYRDFYYAEIFRALSKHCQKSINKWMAILRRKYFNSPFSLSATVFFLLTVAQTIFSVISYFQQKN